ncbi:MAG: hypothetical protein U9Q05_08265, partial [Thermodesulfobacteriota bacterium]|nr:hypothetical protein [Thermodesulfobacteriota bacterium]
VPQLVLASQLVVAQLVVAQLVVAQLVVAQLVVAQLVVAQLVRVRRLAQILAVAIPSLYPRCRYCCYTPIESIVP